MRTALHHCVPCALLPHRPSRAIVPPAAATETAARILGVGLGELQARVKAAETQSAAWQTAMRLVGLGKPKVAMTAFHKDLASMNAQVADLMVVEDAQWWVAYYLHDGSCTPVPARTPDQRMPPIPKRGSPWVAQRLPLTVSPFTGPPHTLAPQEACPYEPQFPFVKDSP